MSKKYCVIIPVYNDWEKVKTNLNAFVSIVEEYKKCIDLFFVDNGSKQIPNELVEFGFQLLICDKPGSYSARNFALEKNIDKYSFFIFTDADCRPDVDWIKNIIKNCENEKFDLLAGRIEMYSVNQPPNFVESYDLVLGLPQNRYVANGYAATANLTISREVLKNIGFFDESRFSGGDAEFCKRAARFGYYLKYAQEAIVHHPARDDFQAIIIKVKRVTGGQTGNGNLMTRIKYLVFNLLPPIRAFGFIYQSKKKYNLFILIKAGVVVLGLWPVRVVESFRSFLFGPQVR